MIYWNNERKMSFNTWKIQDASITGLQTDLIFAYTVVQISTNN